MKFDHLIFASVNLFLAFYTFLLFKKNHSYKSDNKNKQLVQRNLEKEFNFIASNQDSWSKFAIKQDRSISKWFMQNDIEVKRIQKESYENILIYTIFLEIDEGKINRIKEIPFGCVKIVEMQKLNKKVELKIDLILSKIIKTNEEEAQTETTLNLSCILDNEDDWLICINGIWYAKNDKIPDIKVIKTSYDHVVIQYQTMNGQKTDKLFVGKPKSI
ncbi:hypothetical protein [Candidatus Nesciobacter abundans]|uniref:Uncharacterized protein n=1 Tax=Candidatus Nesciobacter abundans TaxID=2601668 RepID=A0A5C0UJ66_9PROT|nr:hypothetical protein [Candidatus Nesciobacter abundans]QEK38844.1 hypothetical protein FZC36_00070 [Candidatus Nesciobacter abundans]